jgi:hypothetical protein
MVYVSSAINILSRAQRNCHRHNVTRHIRLDRNLIMPNDKFRLCLHFCHAPLLLNHPLYGVEIYNKYSKSLTDRSSADLIDHPVNQSSNTSLDTLVKKITVAV